MVMGRNGYGPKWSWAEMVMGRNDPESIRLFTVIYEWNQFFSAHLSMFTEGADNGSFSSNEHGA